jgi:DNA-binding MarR family transcriptional regulator
LNSKINEIFFDIDSISRLSGVDLSFSAKNFFVSLLDYCEINGLFDEDKQVFFVELSITSLRKEFKLSAHTVQSALSSLSACGLIERVKYKPSFSKDSSGGYSLNKPSRIYINYSIPKN